MYTYPQEHGHSVSAENPLKPMHSGENERELIYTSRFTLISRFLLPAETAFRIVETTIHIGKSCLYYIFDLNPVYLI
jgi:hypothetical protein